ncbi:MAG TPA: metal-sensing transcriptional repressor [Caulobacteraceae bacterium]
MGDVHKHLSHPAILQRLRRAHGHLASVIAMIEVQRSCRELAQQLHAVEAAVGAAKRELIHDHIENCLQASAGPDGEANAALEELKALTKYL